eukprot:UN23846
MTDAPVRLQQQDVCWVSLRSTKNPEAGVLLEPIKIPENYRLDETFKCIETSRRLLMFQRSFSEIITEGRKVDEMYDHYLKHFGYAPDGCLEKLHKKCKEIKNCGSWTDYLAWLDVPYVSKADMVEN